MVILQRERGAGFIQFFDDIFDDFFDIEGEGYAVRFFIVQINQGVLGRAGYPGFVFGLPQDEVRFQIVQTVGQEFFLFVGNRNGGCFKIDVVFEPFGHGLVDGSHGVNGHSSDKVVQLGLGGVKLVE